MKFCAAIFDMDGTILDSMGFWHDVGTIFVKKNNLKPEKNLSEKLFSIGMEEGALYLKEKYFSHLTFEEVKNGIIETLKNAYDNEIQPKYGAVELLENLRKKGIPCALATATDRKLFKNAFFRLNLEKYFSAIFTCPELQTDKTSPKIYLEAAKALSCTPEKTIVFEDALTPIKTAKRANFFTVAIFEKFSLSKKTEIKKNCDIFLKDFFDFNAEDFF